MDLEFEEIKPIRVVTRASTRDKLRASFSFTKRKGGATGAALLLTIGMDIAEKAGLKGGDRVTFSVDKELGKIWLIRKSTDGGGFKLLEIKKPNKPAENLRLQLVWTKWKPTERDTHLREISYAVIEDGIKAIYS